MGSLLLHVAIMCSFVPGFLCLCGYGGCPETKEGFLNVHLIPHSHMDLGWLKTVDQYYEDPVQQIYDSVVVELQKQKNRRFISVETGFLWRWWNDQNDTTRAVVRTLVESGQFEFVHGGWVMNDEAAAHYNEIVDQMSLGLRFLNDTFGSCGIPKVAWQIDPFGHSREQASLFAQMGYDGLFFGRLDYQDKMRRIEKKEMEMIWSGSPNNLGKDSWLFTGALYNNYDSPYEFCDDANCNPVQETSNWHNIAEDFVIVAKEWSEAYTTNHLIMSMGGDFHYSDAEKSFTNLDELIKHVNRRQKTHSSKVNLIYSTPTCYLQEVYKANLTFPLKTDDFFPYGSSANALWTGYFTSRPTLKYFIHRTNNFLQACKQLAADASEEDTIENSINSVQVLAESMAVVQHHDAISGTAKQHVTDDYAKRIDIGIKSCQRVIGNAFRYVFVGYEHKYKKVHNEENDYEFCHQLNISMCSGTESRNGFFLSVYNPLAREVKNSYIRLPVIGSQWKVQRIDGPILSTSLPIPERVKDIPGRESEADYEIIFPAGTLPGLTVSYFGVTKLDSLNDEDTKPENNESYHEVVKEEDNQFDNQYFHIENSVGLRATFDTQSGLLKSIQRGNVFQNITQNFYYYEGMDVMRESTFQSSGAYVFRPTSQQPEPIADKVDYKIMKGKHVTEVHQNFSKGVSQIIRLYDTSDALEFEWIVGPIPIKDKIGKEIVTKYSSDISTNGVFFTDANGRELLKRTRNYRPSWNYKVHEEVSGNYYPVNSRMMISESEDLALDKKTLILLNDRSQGGTSMNDGEMEIMLHRRLLDDDGFGVDEPLNEFAFGKGLVARGKHWLVIAGKGTGLSNSIHRPMAQEIFMDRVIGISDIPSLKYSLLPRKTMFSQLGSILPPNIHLLTLEPISKDTFLLRLEHIYEFGEDSQLSMRVTIKIEDFKRALPFVRSIRETTLSGNQWKNESSRLNWRASTQSTEDEISEDNIYVEMERSEAIVLNPMEIKTFLMKI